MYNSVIYTGLHGHDRMVVGFTITYASVPITTNIVSLNPSQEGCTR